ncbi:MAG: selenide, water dikinase SelD [Ruthenibacterium sp.]
MAEELKLTKLAQCAGCGAKVGAGVLAQLLQGMPVQRDDNLLVGYDTSDDASVYKISDELVLVQTLDFFPPIVDDPFLFGQIAAANALSDIYAMGATPKLAMNIMTITQEMSPDTVHEILRGGYDKAFEAGVIITGGHTIQDKEPKYGLSVTGFARPEEILLNCAARPGDVLLLTKPLGIGITTTAHKGGFAPEELYKMAVTQMAQLNKTAFLLARPYALHSCTDVTGFGLMGHATEMARGGAVTGVLESSKVPVLPGVYELAQMGLLPEGMYRNRHFAEPTARAAQHVTRAAQDILYDPQTSGGLLLAVAERDAPALLRALQDSLPCAAIVGYVKENSGAAVEII